MAQEYSNKLKDYLNKTYGQNLYNSDYFLRKVSETSDYFMVCEQSLADSDIAEDTGRLSFRILPYLSKEELKAIGITVDSLSTSDESKSPEKV